MKITIIEDRDSTDINGIKHYDKMVQDISRYANSQNKVTAADFFSNSPFHIIMEQMSKKHMAPPVGGTPFPTGWYYERARKKYNQEQIKMTKAERERFAKKFPKKQIIKKELLAKYLYSIECKPDIVSRGSNWTMKDFGESINKAYVNNKAVFNEFYFKKCVASAIVFQTVDRMVQTAPWYQKGGYKLNIVPYSIAKIISSIPNGKSVDWMRIWQSQSLYPSFVSEVEKVTKMTNDFIQDSKGIIVTEYCKRKETWEAYKGVQYSLSKEFIEDLTETEEIISQANSARKEQKEINDITLEVEVVNLGSKYWRELLDEGEKRGLLSYRDSSFLTVAAEMETTGKLPSQLQAKEIMAIRARLDKEGLIINN